MVGSKHTTSNRKRKLPRSFLESPSLSLVSDFPSKDEDSSPGIVSTNVVSDAMKEIFLDRFVKEIVLPFRPSKVKGGDSFVMVNGELRKKQVPSTSVTTTIATHVGMTWRERLRIGTNQCHKILEQNMKGDTDAPKPMLIVLARDIYPPTMLASVPVMAKRIGIPILLLPGKASNELGQALSIKKASILLFVRALSQNSEHEKINSFLDFVFSELLPK